MPFTRLKHLKQTLPSNSLSGSIISKRENIYYLTGLIQVHPVNREALLFITPDRATLYHSIFLTPPPHSWLTSIPMSPTNPLEQVLLKIFGTGSIAFEANNLTYAEFQRIQTALSHSSLTPTADLLETQRLIKDSTEITAIQKACTITKKTMSWVDDYLINRLSDKLITEISLVRLIEQKLYELGAGSLAFPTIVAFDQNSALPHHLPDNTKLKTDSVVLLDFGCIVNNYTSDMSRTICLGAPPPHFLEIENIVHSAYFAGLNLLQRHFTVTELTVDKSPLKDPGSGLRLRRDPGSNLTASQLDQTVRSIIEKSGYGKEFIHTSGHGLGLEIHEQPSINTHNLQTLKSGMVITLEPGIYLPGKFGYRHENTLLLH